MIFRTRILIFPTHKHHDHCGLASMFAKKGAKIFMNPEEERHSYDCLYMQMGEESQKEQKSVKERWNQRGVDSEAVERLWN